MALAEALKENHTLNKLDLQVGLYFELLLTFFKGINMGSAGALAIADALRTNDGLKEIILELDRVENPQDVRVQLLTH